MLTCVQVWFFKHLLNILKANPALKLGLFVAVFRAGETHELARNEGELVADLLFENKKGLTGEEM